MDFGRDLACREPRDFADRRAVDPLEVEQNHASVERLERLHEPKQAVQDQLPSRRTFRLASRPTRRGSPVVALAGAALWKSRRCAPRDIPRSASSTSRRTPQSSARARSRSPGASPAACPHPARRPGQAGRALPRTPPSPLRIVRPGGFGLMPPLCRPSGQSPLDQGSRNRQGSLTPTAWARAAPKHRAATATPITRPWSSAHDRSLYNPRIE